MTCTYDSGLNLRLLVSWALVVCYMSVIFFFSAQSELSVPYGFSQGDFILHMVEYSVLGFLLSWAFVNSGVVRKFVFPVFLLGLFYGMTDELHQYFVPERNASLLDVTADGLGALIGAYSFYLLHSMKFKGVVPNA